MNFAAVLGSPISHSLSPAIHNAAYKELGIDATYGAFDVEKGELAAFLRARLDDPSWIGFSLTMPLKEEICGQAASLGISLDALSARISSANTIFRKERRWFATSTDVSGFSYLLKNRGFHSVSILGAGGTARAAIESLPADCGVISVFRRNNSRDQQLRLAFPNRQLEIHPWAKSDLAWSSSIVINTVPTRGVEELLPTFRTPSLLLDSLYSPWLPPLSALQSAANGELITGLDLLCAQALRQVSLMTNSNFDEDRLFNVLKEIAIKAVS